MTPSFLQEMSKPQPVPGGGAAFAQGALTALALLTKILALEAGPVRAAGGTGNDWLADGAPSPKN